MTKKHRTNHFTKSSPTWILGIMLMCGCHSSTYFAPEDTESDSDNAIDSDTACRQILTAVFRDFTEMHPDFEREDEGWGPVRRLIKDTMDEERKPVFNLLRGYCKLREDGTCQETADWNSTPMWGYFVSTNKDTDTDTTVDTDTEGYWVADETFYTWYRDDHEIPRPIPWLEDDSVEVNRRIEKEIPLEPNPDAPNSLVFDSNMFLPLDTDEGFGASPAESGENFLFTTEIHTQFDYRSNQEFTFRGDDDLWIFVNGKLILDLGGMHIPYEETIDFDARAEELGIVPGNRYPMDIFHAERHSPGSNFRIETNISCFVSIVPE